MIIVQGEPLALSPKTKLCNGNPLQLGGSKSTLMAQCYILLRRGGYIIRDWRGTILRAGSHQYGCASVIMAEVRALRDGLQAATVAGYKDIIVEGDNQMIINALLGTISTPWQISNALKDVRFLLKFSNQFQVQHIYREANMATD